MFCQLELGDIHLQCTAEPTLLCMIPFVLLYYYLLTIVYIQPLRRGLTRDSATVEGVPAIVFNFFNFSNFLNFSNSCSLIVTEVHHKGGDPSTGSGVADSQSVMQAEHGAAGIDGHASGGPVERVAGTQIEHGLVVGLQ